MYSVSSMNVRCLSWTVTKPATAQQMSVILKAFIKTWPGMEGSVKANVMARRCILLGMRHWWQIWNTILASHPSYPSPVSTCPKIIQNDQPSP